MAVSLENEDKAASWFDDDWGPVNHQQRMVLRMLAQEALLEFPHKYVRPSQNQLTSQHGRCVCDHQREHLKFLG